VTLVPLFPFLVISWGVWLVGSLRRVVSGPVCDVRRRLFCAVVVMRLGVSYSSLAAWAYVIMWGAGSPYCGRGGLLLCFVWRTPIVDSISPGAVFNYRGFCLFVGVCCICELM
jgi:hypothetical protein